MDKSSNPTPSAIPKKHPENMLSAAGVRKAKPGRYADGGGLYLFVEDSGSRRWVLRTAVRGKRRDIGLGSARLVTLAEAREEAYRLRKIARKGGDPLAELRLERHSAPTFEEAARQVHELHSKDFRNPKHRDQWINTLATYAFPVIGPLTVDRIETRDVLAVLSPIWTEKRETARRVRQRIRTVMAWAKAAGHRSGENPVDGVSEGLPKTSTKKEHHPALPYAEVPEFISQLRECGTGTVTKLAFEYLILTAARTSEVLLAMWPEIDLDTKTWSVPAERMKAGEEHRVPLSARCIEILRAVREATGGGKAYVFPGQSPDRPLSNMTLLKALKGMNRSDITAHGFRSSFRDWAEERTKFKRSVVEAALAHTVKDKVEAAYLRTKLFSQRIPLMDAWAAFATAAPKEKVVSISREA